MQNEVEKQYLNFKSIQM